MASRIDGVTTERSARLKGSMWNMGNVRNADCDPTIGRATTDDRPTSDSLATDRRPPSNRLTLAGRPTSGRRPIASWQTADSLKTTNRPTADSLTNDRRPRTSNRPPTDRQPNANRQPTDRQPTANQPTARRLVGGLRPSAAPLLVLFLMFAIAIPLNGASADESDQNVVDPTQRADNSFIYDTTVASLFEQASLYDGRTVQIVGEVIGDRIAASQNGTYWITLTATEEEDKSTISVLMSEEQTRQIDHYGRYGVVGTTLQVRGTYHQACSEHDGLPDIHATNSSVLSRGIERPDQFVSEDFFPGAIAVLVGVILMGVFYIARERTR